jgi:hypothetical protein
LYIGTYILAFFFFGLEHQKQVIKKKYQDLTHCST